MYFIWTRATPQDEQYSEVFELWPVRIPQNSTPLDQFQDKGRILCLQEKMAYKSKSKADRVWLAKLVNGYPAGAICGPAGTEAVFPSAGYLFSGIHPCSSFQSEEGECSSVCISLTVFIWTRLHIWGICPGVVSLITLGRRPEPSTPSPLSLGCLSPRHLTHRHIWFSHIGVTEYMTPEWGKISYFIPC